MSENEGEGLQAQMFGDDWKKKLQDSQKMQPGYQKVAKEYLRAKASAQSEGEFQVTTQDTFLLAKLLMDLTDEVRALRKTVEEQCTGRR